MYTTILVIFQYITRIVASQIVNYTYTTQYAYDENGNLISITDPRGNSRTAVYDALNRQTKVTNEEGGTVEYTYDVLGRVTMAVNEDGAVTKYTYDAKGRVTAIEDAYFCYYLCFLGCNICFIYDWNNCFLLYFLVVLEQRWQGKLE